jgi:hypothetical protein
LDLDAIDRRLDAVDRRLDAISTRFDRRWTIRRSCNSAQKHSVVIDSIDQRLDFLASAQQARLQYPAAHQRAMLDLGSLMGQLTRAQQQSTDRHFDLETAY